MINSKSRSPIRVLLVDDSAMALVRLQKILASAPEIEVVGTARNGKEALKLIPQLQPKVICTDLHMPVMDGLTLTREVMARFPRPILIVSVSVIEEEDAHNIIPLLEAGAIDVLPKPRGEISSDDKLLGQELIRKIKVLSGVVVFTKHGSKQPSTALLKETILPEKTKTARESSKSVGHKSQRSRIVAIGASAGGPQALHTILAQLPPEFPVPILCIQHVSDGFMQELVDWLGSQCKVEVQMAQPGELPLPGKVYFPQEGKHLKVTGEGKLILSGESLCEGHRPSVTVTFQSVAQYYGRSAVGVLLSGMGRDGAEGLRAIAEEGGITIAQDEKTCVVFGMPKAAIELNAAQHILPVGRIAKKLIESV